MNYCGRNVLFSKKKKRNFLCSLAAGPSPGAMSGISKLSPQNSSSGMLAALAQPHPCLCAAHRFPLFFCCFSFFLFFFLPVFSRDLRFWLKLPPALPGKSPRGFCGGEGVGGGVGSGLELSRWTPAAFWGWDLVQHIPRTLTSPSGPRKSPPASARSSAAGWSTCASASSLPDPPPPPASG